MADETPKVAVVMIAGSEPAPLLKTIEELNGQAAGAPQIIVLGAPGSQKAFKHYENVRFTAVSQPSSTAHYLNIGLRAARAEVALVLQPGSIPSDRYWLNEMLEPFEDASVGAVCSQYRKTIAGKVSSGELIQEVLDSPSAMKRKRRVPVDVAFLTGRCDAVRVSALQAVNFLDETDFPWRGWEKDLSLRLRTAKYRIVQGNAATAIMLEPGARHSGIGFARNAIEDGRAEQKITRRYRDGTDTGPIFLIALLSAAAALLSSLSLSYSMLAFCILFGFALFQAVRIPFIHFHVPAGLFHFALFAVFVVTTRQGGALEELVYRNWPGTHPAFMRQALFIASGTAVYLAAVLISGVHMLSRAARLKMGPARLLLVFPAALLWPLLAGLGYLKGRLEASSA